MKLKVAKAAIKYLKPNMGIAIGTGSTVNLFIDELAKVEYKFDFIVSSSIETTKYLMKKKIKVVNINYTNNIDLYIDGADQANYSKELIKGGGGALTGEKICRVRSDKFICMIDESKIFSKLGVFPIAIEVIPKSKKHVYQSLIELKGKPIYRKRFITDNRNIIFDVYHMNIVDPIVIEKKLNQIVGVVCNGIFAVHPADILLIAKKSGLIKIIQ